MSGLEDEIAMQLEAHNIPFHYEDFTLPYEQPAKLRKYNPDFILPNAIIIEGKGRFVTADRQKHLMIAKQYPQLDIRFVFSNPNTKISKRSKTTYGKWCEKNQFLFAKKRIPLSWIEETADPETIRITKEVLGWKPKRRRRRKAE